MRTNDDTSSDLASGSPIPRQRVVLTVEQAAQALGIGRTFMYELVGSGEVESVLIGRLRRVPADALADYVARLRVDKRQGVGI
jgi:excisionase family DNA binding protein